MARRRRRRGDGDAAGVRAYTNRFGDTYYLHQGKTKTGKPRYYFAKTVREGALSRMPVGFEVSESINGVVSVRRKRTDEPKVPASDVEIVRAAAKRQPQLQDHQVRVVGREIVIFEPSPTRERLRGLDLGPGPVCDSFIDERMRHAQYDPVMKFEQGGGGYAAYRMTYRGKGGWLYLSESGKLAGLVRKYVRHIGTDEFFELF